MFVGKIASASLDSASHGNLSSVVGMVALCLVSVVFQVMVVQLAAFVAHQTRRYSAHETVRETISTACLLLCWPSVAGMHCPSNMLLAQHNAAATLTQLFGISDFSGLSTICR